MPRKKHEHSGARFTFVVDNRVGRKRADLPRLDDDETIRCGKSLEMFDVVEGFGEMGERLRHHISADWTRRVFESWELG